MWKDTVACDTYSYVVHQHLVQANWSKGALDNVGN